MLTMDWIQYSLLTIDTLIIITTYEKSVIVIPIFRGAETMTMRDYIILMVTQLYCLSSLTTDQCCIFSLIIFFVIRSQ